MITRELPANEWYRLVGTPLEVCLNRMPLHCMRVLAVEEGVTLVGVVALMQAVHVEGLWIAPAYRGRVSVMRRLVTTMRRWVGGLGHGVLAGSDSAAMDAILDTLGASRVPASLWLWSETKET